LGFKRASRGVYLLRRRILSFAPDRSWVHFVIGKRAHIRIVSGQLSFDLNIENLNYG